ncbi:hypothetical protein T265_11637 [Opisthorchis viverrini]|uniref:U8 snoRNA-decapping enzyme n=2 Tax=Opisthorchis viverrini TaxID=6198 RepID=A0A074YY17_OPIVI|nr:hypothetical protein T265_11637 [Opisthorchis viverrini]KER19651.1 hypothetical protein T265_11637 [Opisthorchis viverrini]
MITPLQKLSTSFPQFVYLGEQLQRVDPNGLKCAVHGMYFTNTDAKFLNEFSNRAYVMMHLRFDGHFGFPGGVVDPEDETIVSALNREVAEEMGATRADVAFRDEDFVVVHQCTRSKYLLYFFAKRVTMDQFEYLEQTTLRAEEYGRETMGVVRVPIYTMEEGFRGLPAFLTNSFAGNAKLQLLSGLLVSSILSWEEIHGALRASCPSSISA